MPHDFEPAVPNTEVASLNGDPKHDSDPAYAQDASVSQNVTNPAYSSASDPYGLETDPAAATPISQPPVPPAAPARADNVLTYDLHLPTWLFFAVAWVGDVSAVLLIAIRTWRLIFQPGSFNRAPLKPVE